MVHLYELIWSYMFLKDTHYAIEARVHNKYTFRDFRPFIAAAFYSKVCRVFIHSLASLEKKINNKFTELN